MSSDPCSAPCLVVWQLLLNLYADDNGGLTDGATRVVRSQRPCAYILGGFVDEDHTTRMIIDHNDHYGAW